LNTPPPGGPSIRHCVTRPYATNSLNGSQSAQVQRGKGVDVIGLLNRKIVVFMQNVLSYSVVLANIKLSVLIPLQYARW
jgi:hypothetical protein